LVAPSGTALDLVRARTDVFPVSVDRCTYSFAESALAGRISAPSPAPGASSPGRFLDGSDIVAFRKARAETSLSAATLREQAETLRRDGKLERAEVFERKALDRQRKGTKPSTINRDLRTLRVMLKCAVPDFRFPAGAFFQDDETRVRWLRPEEELLVLESMRSPFREIAKLAALTPMRLNEIRLLRREDVHLEQGVILLPKAKAGARPVVLGADAQKVLSKQQEANPDSEWVFPGRMGGRTTAPTSDGCSAGLLAKPASGTSTSMTSGATGPRWRSTAASRLRS
jgi:integrase